MSKIVQPLSKYHGYSAGHPWYYFLGGNVPSPKQIQLFANSSIFRGYLEADIKKIDEKTEPKRSNELRKLRDQIKTELRQNLDRYRQLARQLRKARANQQPNKESCACRDVDTNMSLKFNHLYNDFAHLEYIDELMKQQLDLFSDIG